MRRYDVTFAVYIKVLGTDSEIREMVTIKDVKAFNEKMAKRRAKRALSKRFFKRIGFVNTKEYGRVQKASN